MTKVAGKHVENARKKVEARPYKLADYDPEPDGRGGEPGRPLPGPVLPARTEVGRPPARPAVFAGRTVSRGGGRHRTGTQGNGGGDREHPPRNGRSGRGHPTRPGPPAERLAGDRGPAPRPTRSRRTGRSGGRAGRRHGRHSILLGWRGDELHPRGHCHDDSNEPADSESIR